MTAPKVLAQQKVIVAFPHGHEWSARFGKSLWRLGLYDAAHNKRIIGDAMASSGANITNARNEIVDGTLISHDADWLFWIDTDMVFEPDIIDRMVKAAHPEKRPILGALCFSIKDGVKAMPTMYMLRDDNKVGRMFNYPRNELVQVGATGTGCLLVHRSVLLKMRDKFPKPYQWFQECAVGGVPVGEDITFCIRAGSLGFPVFVDTAIKVGHDKPFVVDEAMFEAQQRFDAVRELPNFVVVPFKDRHDLTQQLVDQLTNEGYADAFLFDHGSSVPPPAEWNAIDASGWGFHRMWNRGVELALERSGGACNIAFLNNDVRFPSRGWLDGLANALRSHPQLVAVSPNYDGRTFDADIMPVNGICAGRYDGTGGMAGFAFMARGEWFTAGDGWRFPEEYEFFFGDTEFALSVEQAGGLIGVVKDVPVEHIGGGGQTPRPEPESIIMKRDGERFRAKWNAVSSK